MHTSIDFSTLVANLEHDMQESNFITAIAGRGAEKKIKILSRQSVGTEI